MGARGTSMILLLATAVGVLAPGHASTEREPRPDEYRIIVNPANPAREMSRSFLRNAFLKKTTQWDNGETVRPIDLTRRFPVRDRFTREVLNKTPAQLRSYWNQQIFSGKGVPPPELDSEAAMISYVLRNRGAVGYLPATADPEGAAVVTLK